MVLSHDLGKCRNASTTHYHRPPLHHPLLLWDTTNPRTQIFVWNNLPRSPIREPFSSTKGVQAQLPPERLEGCYCFLITSSCENGAMNSLPTPPRNPETLGNGT